MAGIHDDEGNISDGLSDFSPSHNQIYENIGIKTIAAGGLNTA